MRNKFAVEPNTTMKRRNNLILVGPATAYTALTLDWRGDTLYALIVEAEKVQRFYLYRKNRLVLMKLDMSCT